MDTWQLQEAKAKLSEVVRRCQHAPQVITVHDEEKAILLSPEEYGKLTSRKKNKKQNLVEFLRNSPLMGVDLDLTRDQSPMRDIDL